MTPSLQPTPEPISVVWGCPLLQNHACTSYQTSPTISPPSHRFNTVLLSHFSFLSLCLYSETLLQILSFHQVVNQFFRTIGAKCAADCDELSSENNVDSLSFLQLNSDHVQNALGLQGLGMPQYIHLYWPAIEWILQCIAYKASEVRTLWLPVSIPFHPVLIPFYSIFPRPRWTTS